MLRFMALGSIAAGVLGLSLGPFVAAGQLPQVCRRAGRVPSAYCVCRRTAFALRAHLWIGVECCAA